MNRRAFSLTELMIGTLVSLIVIGGMAAFVGNSGYKFQNQKNMLSERAELQRTITAISRDIMEAGGGTTVEGLITGTTDPFMDVYTQDGLPPDLSTVLTFKKLNANATLDQLGEPTGEDQPAPVAWDDVTYAVNGARVDPVTGESVMTLERDGIPYIMNITSFQIEIGVDEDENGAIADTEWKTTFSSDAAERLNMLAAATKLRLTITRESDVLTSSAGKVTDEDAYNSESTMVREIYLRNRGSVLSR